MRTTRRTSWSSSPRTSITTRTSTISEVRQALSVIRERIDAGKAAEAAAAAVDEAEEKIAAAGGDWRSQFLAEWNGDEAADGASIKTGGSRASRAIGAAAAGGGGGAQPDWDSSTNAGDRTKHHFSETSRAMAEEMLRENPELAQKHSVRSLAAVVEKQQGGGAPTKQRWVPPEHGITEEDLPPLRVVTVIENPRVPTKDVDPSNLPYLHRNPAV